MADAHFLSAGPWAGDTPCWLALNLSFFHGGLKPLKHLSSDHQARGLIETCNVSGMKKDASILPF